MAAGIAEGTDSELHLVYVAGTGGGDPRVYEQMRQSSRALLDEQAEKMRDAGAKITKKHLRNGRPGQEIVALAEELGAGLIVMGGRGLGTLFAQSVSFYQVDRAWGTALVATAVSVACFVAARAVERWGVARFT